MSPALGEKLLHHNSEFSWMVYYHCTSIFENPSLCICGVFTHCCPGACMTHYTT